MFKLHNAPSIKDWFSLLNWPKLPNFGSFHTSLGTSSFADNYYINEDIETLYLNLSTTLEFGGLDSQNVRIIGHPGAGKTSFLYAMKFMSEQEDQDNPLSKYYFYIYHINKSDGLSEEDSYRLEIEKNVLSAWKGFFSLNGFADDFLRIESQKLSYKESINLATLYYKEHKSQFSKIMIFAIDDVDLLPGEDVIKVVNHLLRSLEINSVKKWLSIRRVTIENYPADTKSRVEEFFPDPYDFPKISLLELISHRINKAFKESAPKIPFNKLLCDETIYPICEGNMREGLAILKTLLENIHPKGFELKTSEKVIQEYIAKSAIDTLCRSQKLLDLHSQSFRICSFPLAVDILACIRQHSHEPIIYGSTTECCTRRDFLSHNLVGTDDRVAKVRTQDFKQVISKLIEHKLVFKKSKDYYDLTEKGKILSSFSTRMYYFNFHRENNKAIIDDEDYWLLSEHQLDYADIVNNFITVKHRQ